MRKKAFGCTKSGEKTYLYCLENHNHMSIGVTNYGAHLVFVKVPDKNGVQRDVVLGYDDVSGYEEDTYCLGATIGRNANRTKNARFTLNGQVYELDKSEASNNCHSGPNGYQFRIWNAKQLSDTEVQFSLISPHLDQGFPGKFLVSTTYTLTEENEIIIHYEGMSSEDTVVNLTHHSYFNLNGHDSGNILGQFLKIKAKEYSPIEDEQSIPTGERAAVTGTAMDFRSFKMIGCDIYSEEQQLKLAGDYNHSFWIDKPVNSLGLMAEAYSRESGICLRAKTDLPAVQLYTGLLLCSIAAGLPDL
ncbi:MAG: galactose mutarotase [Hespellia sp.]|nr:galactose mutarotase [Hespellia sp.]